MVVNISCGGMLSGLQRSQRGFGEATGGAGIGEMGESSIVPGGAGGESEAYGAEEQ
jgi:hypothetical protein